MATKVAINGFGRIGRAVFRRIIEKHPDLKIVAINDLTDTKTLAHLLKYDSLYGIYEKKVGFKEDKITVNGEEFPVFSERDPSKLPWKDLEVDIVLECTGVFRTYEDSVKHLEAGAKRVIISAPPKSENIPTYVLGVNEEKFDKEKDLIISNSSCTTNCLAPIVKVLHEAYKIEEGFLTTVHSYTNDQRILDLPHKDLRRARAAALSIIPTTTGAAKSVTEVIPELKGKLDGLALRVPTPTVSVVDFVCRVENPPENAEEVNYLFKKKSLEERFKNILGIEDAELVSVDYRGNSFSAVVDAHLTNVIGNLIKVIAWYDNEWGYSCRLAEMTEYVAKKIQE